MKPPSKKEGKSRKKPKRIVPEVNVDDYIKKAFPDGVEATEKLM